MASTTLSSVAGRPLQSLFAPREFLLPAGALGSMASVQASGLALTVGSDSGLGLGLAAIGISLNQQGVGCPDSPRRSQRRPAIPLSSASERELPAEACPEASAGWGRCTHPAVESRSSPWDR